jgi:hypothetical protein
MARRMVVVPEEFLKVFKQEPQIPLNFLRNDDLLADRLNKALNQKTLPNKQTVSTQTVPDVIDQKPTTIKQPAINETTPTVAQQSTPPEQQSTPYHSPVGEAPPIRISEQTSLNEQRINSLRNKLKSVGAYSPKKKEVYREGTRVEHSNIDHILSYAFNPDATAPPKGYKAIARYLKIMNESDFPNTTFQTAVDQSRGQSPIIPGKRKTPTPFVAQRGKGSKKTQPLRWNPY